MKWWIAILLDLDGRGTAKRPQPLLFDSANAKILPADDKGRVWLEVRLDRYLRPGRKNGESTLVRAALKTGGKRAHYARPALQMAAGERTLSGAQLTYDPQHKKWFAALSYEEEQHEMPALDPARVGVLRPGLRWCWRLRAAGHRTRWFGGRGNHVAHIRRALLLQRWSRQHGYAFAPPRKGRGRDRALEPLFKLRNRWLNFTKRSNELTVSEVTDWCLAQGIGRLILVGGDPSRRLATAGKVEGREDSTGWPFYQLEQLLQQKCQKLGITVELRVFCGGKHRRQGGAPKQLTA